MHNCIHGCQPAKTLNERVIVFAERISLLSMFLDSPLTVGTAVVWKIGLEDSYGFQREYHGYNGGIIKPEEDRFFVWGALIIP